MPDAILVALILLAFLVLDVAAVRWGVDTRDGFRTR